MKQRRYATKPGTVSKLCACGTIITPTQVCCFVCWDKVPQSLRQEYLTARASGDGLAVGLSSERIRDHVRAAAR